MHGAKLSLEKGRAPEYSNSLVNRRDLFFFLYFFYTLPYYKTRLYSNLQKDCVSCAPLLCTYCCSGAHLNVQRKSCQTKFFENVQDVSTSCNRCVRRRHNKSRRTHLSRTLRDALRRSCAVGAITPRLTEQARQGEHDKNVHLN